MGKNNLKELITYVKNNATHKYPKLMNLADYLGRERLKIVGNDLRKYLENEENEMDKDVICETVESINEIAKESGFNFYISPKWDVVEKFLRNTILDDLSEEFKRQGN